MDPFNAKSVVSVRITDGMRRRVRETAALHQAQLDAFASLLLAFNRSHNLVSRRSNDDDLYVRHVLHSLALSARPFRPSAVVIDWGAGGGLPSIPIAISTPEVTVIALDAAEKKMRAVTSMSRRLGLSNLEARAERAEFYQGRWDYSVSRATTSLAELWRWHRRASSAPAFSGRGNASDGADAAWAQGLLALKGGELEPEISALFDEDDSVAVDLYALDALLEHSYFAAKSLVHVHR